MFPKEDHFSLPPPTKKQKLELNDPSILTNSDPLQLSYISSLSTAPTLQPVQSSSMYNSDDDDDKPLIYSSGARSLTLGGCSNNDVTFQADDFPQSVAPMCGPAKATSGSRSKIKKEITVSPTAVTSEISENKISTVSSALGKVWL